MIIVYQVFANGKHIEDHIEEDNAKSHVNALQSFGFPDAYYKPTETSKTGPAGILVPGHLVNQPFKRRVFRRIIRNLQYLNNQITGQATILGHTVQAVYAPREASLLSNQGADVQWIAVQSIGFQAGRRVCGVRGGAAF